LGVNNDSTGEARETASGGRTNLRKFEGIRIIESELGKRYSRKYETAHI
jgi:hypothetical protein